MRECVTKISQPPPDYKTSDWSGNNGNTNAAKQSTEKEILKH
jgi:hypothetical protein